MSLNQACTVRCVISKTQILTRFSSGEMTQVHIFCNSRNKVKFLVPSRVTGKGVRSPGDTTLYKMEEQKYSSARCSKNPEDPEDAESYDAEFD